jgi:signal transduction protein with GAF and PtsI domain
LNAANKNGQNTGDNMEPIYRRKDFFEALYEVAKVINASLEPKEVLKKIVNSVAEAMDVKACSLRILGNRGKRLTLGAYKGLSEGYIQKGPILVAESGLDRKALAGESVYLHDAQSSDEWQYKARAKEEGIRSVLVVPLLVEEKAIGVLRAYSGEIREFDPDEMKFLEAAASLSALALENARLHEALKRAYDLLIQHEYRLDDN